MIVEILLYNDRNGRFRARARWTDFSGQQRTMRSDAHPSAHECLVALEARLSREESLPP